MARIAHIAQSAERPYGPALERLRAAGLRPTRQRLALAKLLFDAADRHITAEMLHGEALRARVRVSLATVYNTLHQFTLISTMLISMGFLGGWIFRWF